MSPLLVVELVHPVLQEIPRLLPYLVPLAHVRPGQVHNRLDRRERLHRAQPELYLPVGALLDVVGPEPLPVRGREVEVGRRIGLRLLEYRRGPRAADLLTRGRGRSFAGL